MGRVLIMSDIIQDVMNEEVGIDFNGTPTTGKNSLVVEFEAVILDGAIIQNDMNAVDEIQNTF